MRATILRVLLLVTGVAATGYLAADVGVAAILNAFRELSWRLAVIVVFPTILAVVLDTAGWRAVLPTAPGSRRRLLAVRVAGDAVNLATPTASVGGEPLKAYLLRPHVSLDDALVSVVADKTTGVIAQVLALVAGLLVAGALLAPSSPLVITMLVLLLVEVLAVAGFVAVQLGGVAGRGGRLLARLGIESGSSRHERLDGIDRALRAVYVRHWRRALASVACHFLAFAVAALEVYLVVRLLGVPVSLSAAFAIGTLGTAVKFVTFMVPGSLGALEGGNMAIFAAFGLGGPIGLAYTLVRRVRELGWIAAGFAAMALLTARPRPERGEGRGSADR